MGPHHDFPPLSCISQQSARRGGTFAGPGGRCWCGGTGAGLSGDGGRCHSSSSQLGASLEGPRPTASLQLNHHGPLAPTGTFCFCSPSWLKTPPPGSHLSFS